MPAGMGFLGATCVVRVILYLVVALVVPFGVLAAGAPPYLERVEETNYGPSRAQRVYESNY